MKARLQTKELRDAIERTHYIGRRLTLPMLLYTHVELRNGKAVFTSCDLERIIQVEIPSSNDQIGTLLLPRVSTMKYLHGDNGVVELEQGDSLKRVKLSRDGLGDMQILDIPKVDDFPPMQQIPEDLDWHSFDAKWLCRMLRIVANASAKEEENRPVLSAVVCHDGAIAAADGFRLVAFKDERLVFGLGDKEAIIPLDTVNILLRLFSKTDTLEIAFQEDYQQFQTSRPAQYISRAHIRSGNVSLISQLVQGTYPNYHQLIPSEYDCKVSFSTPLMAQRLNMIDPQIIAGGIIRLSFQKIQPSDEDDCLIRAISAEEAEYSLNMPVKIMLGNGGKIAFNMSYVLDAIKAFSVCDLELTSMSSPGKFTGDIEGLTIVVMPMFVQW